MIVLSVSLTRTKHFSKHTPCHAFSARLYTDAQLLYLTSNYVNKGNGIRDAHWHWRPSIMGVTSVLSGLSERMKKGPVSDSLGAVSNGTRPHI